VTTENEIRATDQRLESGATRASEELAQHRWHWTLDETNPDRMSLRAYARLVGRSLRAIQNVANGYAAFVASQGDEGILVTRSLADHIEAAGLGVEREAATAAVAEASGSTFANVAANKRDEVTSTLGVARERAERRGTTVDEEVVNVAQHRERARQADREERQQRRRMRTAEYMRYEANLGKAARALRAALDMGDSEFADEERALLMATLANVRALLGLVEMRLAGTADVDWDAELTRLGEAGT
jgi:hypothetical protein